jgi:hypothetical protein
MLPGIREERILMQVREMWYEAQQRERKEKLLLLQRQM